MLTDRKSLLESIDEESSQFSDGEGAECISEDE